MTKEAAAKVDGRVARRERNIEAVLDVVLAMFAEDAMFPTMEQVAERSGLSLRSLYRYFSEPGELLEATIARNRQLVTEITKLPDLGEGEFDGRLEAFVAMRLALYEGIGPVMRATVANAMRHRRIGDLRAEGRLRLRQQFADHFAPELSRLAGDQRQTALVVGDLMTQPESIDYLRQHLGMPVAEAHAIIASTLRVLLEGR